MGRSGLLFTCVRSGTGRPAPPADRREVSPALHPLVRNHQGGLLRAVSSAAVRGRHPPRKHRLPSRSKSFSLCWGSGEPRREAWGSTLGRGTGGRDQFWLQGPSWGWGDVTAVPPELRSHLPGARGHCPPGWGGGGGAGFQLSWPQRRTGALEVPHRVGPELLGAGPAGKWGLSEVRRGRGVGRRGEACLAAGGREPAVVEPGLAGEGGKH